MASTPWTKFRNLCRYYIDCTRYSEKSQEYLFADQLNLSFCLPALPVDWHLKEQFDIDTNKVQRYIRSYLLNLGETEDIFIGYPLSSFISPKGTHCLCPILLFPINVSPINAGRTSGLHIEVDSQGIDINRDWVEYHVPREQQAYFCNACERIVGEVGMIDVETVLSFISNYLKTCLSPNDLDFSLRHSDASHGILNTATMFVGNKTKYTRSLIRELNRIRSEPDSILDKTSLAYVFRDPVLKPPMATDTESYRIPAVFTENPMNGEQYEAVEKGLNAPVTQITGPPGTGKSHVSVNLVANEVYNGGSVLFTSKNHKAIHAVFEMCQKAKPDDDFNIMEFCTAPGEENAAQWDKMQNRLEQMEDIVVSRLKHVNIDMCSEERAEDIQYTAIDDVEHGLSCFRDAAENLQKYDDMRARISQLERLIIETDFLLEKIPLTLRTSVEFEMLLKQCRNVLVQEPKDSFITRLLIKFKRLLGKKDDYSEVYQQLNHLVPGIAPYYSNPRSIEKSIRGLLKSLHFRTLVERWRMQELEIIQKEESECNYDALKASLHDANIIISKSIKKAYMLQRCHRMQSSEVEELVSRIEGALEAVSEVPLSFMASVETQNRYDKATELFSKYLDVFPAWAVTLLSLHKASPCLPGIFSLVIIDEASQCEIPPIIPALFRAKRVVVVGDPEQFPPVITLKKNRNEVLRARYNIINAEMKKYSYCGNTAFSVIPKAHDACINLVEHFRCMDEIAMYFNEEFYKSELCPCVGSRENQGYNTYNLKPGMHWIDIVGGDEEECNAVLDYLMQLRARNFPGSVGIISPLRKIANEMKNLCFSRQKLIPSGLNDERINTANAFQGGQCDIILFLLGLNRSRAAHQGELWYITSEENKYIYNVSVSRAKVCFVTFGDKNAANATGISRIVKLIPRDHAPLNVKIGPGEIRLFQALVDIGLTPERQYPICGRYLDLAFVREKIDIEVDGQAWHLDRNGCRKADDIHRDLLLECNGWTVLRFWHHEIINDIQNCVQKIRETIQERQSLRVGEN